MLHQVMHEVSERTTASKANVASEGQQNSLKGPQKLNRISVVPPLVMVQKHTNKLP